MRRIVLLVCLLVVSVVGCISVGRSPTRVPPTLADEIEDLDHLHRKGLISKEDFELGKYTLLNSGRSARQELPRIMESVE